ncbi:MAG: heme exporter ATP-binding protein CcmA [Pseudomonadota bacterium]|jgi:ABC-type transport system involved in cytochrome c biogenesis permease component
MTPWLLTLWALIHKEWRLEWRSKELFTLLACNAVLFSVLVGTGVSSAMIDAATTEKIYPMLLWVVFMLSSITSVTRFNEQELEGRGFEGLLLSGVSGAQMYLAKVAIMTLFFFVSFILLVALLAVSLDRDVSGIALSLGMVGLGASSALASLLALLAAVASTSKLKGILLPIISIPVLFPVFLSGMEMTTELVLNGALSEGSAWPLILVCAQTLYLVAGINVFEIAIKE